MRQILAAALILLPACHASNGQGTFPSKPLTIMAPANPGGGWDQTARLVQQALTAEKIVPVPVEVINRAGAGGTIGLAEFATSHRTDPYITLMLGRVMLGAILTNHSAVTLKDTIPLARLINEYEVIAVASDSKYRTFADLIADFRRDPQRISWGGGSAGGTDHILIALLAQAAGLDPRLINYIPHSGGGEAAVAVMGGHVSAGVSGYGEWKPLVQAGRLRFLAVSSESRMPGDATPTIREGGLDVTIANWRSMAAPPGASKASRDWMVDALRSMCQSPTWKEILRKNDWDDAFLAGPEFEAFLAAETASNAAILNAMGMGAGPSAFPWFIGAGLLISIVWMMWSRSGPSPDAVRWQAVAAGAALVIAYCLAFEIAGYWLSTAVLIVLTARLLGSRSLLRDAVAGAVISGSIYGVFEILLRRGLPHGWLG